ncbi:MAG: dihydrolipoamide acetyltransferase family protein [Spirochaetota bacterium]
MPGSTSPGAAGRGEDGALEPPWTEAPAGVVRKVIARRMLESKLTIPHFYLFDQVDMEPACAFRRELEAERGVKVSFTDLIVAAAARTLLEHPECNVSYRDGVLRRYRAVNINVAVAVEGGLLVPTVRDCGSLGLLELSGAIRELADRARNKKLRPRENQGGTFTVSNLGVFGLEGSFSIINPPQAMILTTGAVREAPVARGGVLTAGTVMAVTLSCDHRAVDGAEGARFLMDFKRALGFPREFPL